MQQCHLSTGPQRATAVAACAATMTAGYGFRDATRVARAIARPHLTFPATGPYEDDVPPRGHDGALPVGWQPVDPTTYILTVAAALWADGNN